MERNNIKLQVAGFLDNSLVNGPGLRSVVFTSGCNHKCEGCQNAAMQDFSYGEQINISEVYERIKDNIPIIRGVTFSGGEPLEQAAALSELGSRIKKLGLNLWCYTGYTFEYILNNEENRAGWSGLLSSIDVLIDGKFEKDKCDSGLKYRGSSNQRIIDVKESLKEGKIVTIE